MRTPKLMCQRLSGAKALHHYPVQTKIAYSSYVHTDVYQVFLQYRFIQIFKIMALQDASSRCEAFVCDFTIKLNC